MFKRILISFLFFASFYSFCFAETGSVSVWSIDPMNIPKISQWVNDYSNVLSTQEFNELNNIAKDYESKTTNQIVVILFPNRNWNELIDIWLKVFRENWIWQKDKNNWLLLLIATEEKKIRIITWYSLEWDIPDILASDIIEKDIRPAVNEWRFYDWVKKYYDRVISAIWTDEWKKMQENGQFTAEIITFIMALIFWLVFSMNIVPFIFWGFFFSTIFFTVWSFFPIIWYLIWTTITFIIWYIFQKNKFFKNFISMPKWWSWWTWWSSGGWSSWWGWWFSWGWWSSGGWGAGD